MPVDIVKTVNFGSSKSSLGSPGYRIYSTSGALSGSRVTSGVGEIISGAGIYSASIHIADNFTGHILWDTGESTPVYASEDIDNTLHILSMLSSSIDFTRNHVAGRWKMDTESDVMIFYKEDNSTEIARYALTDQNGSPTTTSVHERTKL
tara:strand:+ start:268 stop:717 length:450 start_codon:yes stop_codon:yes gene_type:complete